jgi:hypothetical protein
MSESTKKARKRVVIEPLIIDGKRCDILVTLSAPPPLRLNRKAKAAAALAAVAHFDVSVHTADRDRGRYPVNRAAARELSHKRR